MEGFLESMKTNPVLKQLRIPFLCLLWELWQGNVVCLTPWGAKLRSGFGSASAARPQVLWWDKVTWTQEVQHVAFRGVRKGISWSPTTEREDRSENQKNYTTTPPTLGTSYFMPEAAILASRYLGHWNLNCGQPDKQPNTGMSFTSEESPKFAVFIHFFFI